MKTTRVFTFKTAWDTVTVWYKDIHKNSDEVEEFEEDTKNLAIFFEDKGREKIAEALLNIVTIVKVSIINYNGSGMVYEKE